MLPTHVILDWTRPSALVSAQDNHKRTVMFLRSLFPVLLASSLSVSAAAGPAAPRPAGAALYPSFRLDLGAANPAVRPGDDFFEYCNGAWLARTDIPPDKPYMTEAQAV